MTVHIDVSFVLRESVSASYSHLVTRPTGAAVRGMIERELDRAAPASGAVTVIDFSHVGMMDYSCADEVVAKLLLPYVDCDREQVERYFIFRGVSDSHLDAIETVLERHNLALVLQPERGTASVVGTLGDAERRAWETVSALGRAGVADVAVATGLDDAAVRAALESLARLRLVIPGRDGYLAVGLPQ